MKGIILAGGAGSRLYPITKAISKQIMPVYDKPMIYYPLATLMQAGIREILIITLRRDQQQFQRLLGDGRQFGCSFAYAAPSVIRGTADALVIGEEFIGGDAVAVILGDTLLHQPVLDEKLERCAEPDGAVVFAAAVSDPRRYGVISLAANTGVKHGSATGPGSDGHGGKVVSIEEKPARPRSPYATIGLGFFDNDAVAFSKAVQPSVRGEHELPDVYQAYLQQGKLYGELLSSTATWFDTGTLTSLTEAARFVEAVVKSGAQVGSPEETAWRKRFITDTQLRSLAQPLSGSEYGQYLLALPR